MVSKVCGGVVVLLLLGLALVAGAAAESDGFEKTDPSPLPVINGGSPKNTTEHESNDHESLPLNLTDPLGEDSVSPLGQDDPLDSPEAMNDTLGPQLGTLQESLAQTKTNLTEPLPIEPPGSRKGDGDKDQAGDGQQDEPSDDPSDSNKQKLLCRVNEDLCSLGSTKHPGVHLPPGLALPGLPLPSDDEATQNQFDDEDPSRKQAALTSQQESGRPAEAATLTKTLLIAAGSALAATVVIASAQPSVTAWVVRLLSAFNGLVVSLYARLAKGKLLDHPTRKELHMLVQASPGACITEIQSVLGTRASTTRHHLRILETHCLVVAVKSGRRRCYFPTDDGLSPKTRKTVAALSSKPMRRVYNAIRSKPGISQKDLSAALGLSRTSVLFHIRRLESASIIRQAQNGRENAYHPVVTHQESDPRPFRAPVEG